VWRSEFHPVIRDLFVPPGKFRQTRSCASRKKKNSRLQISVFDDSVTVNNIFSRSLPLQWIPDLTLPVLPPPVCLQAPRRCPRLPSRACTCHNTRCSRSIRSRSRTLCLLCSRIILSRPRRTTTWASRTVRICRGIPLQLTMSTGPRRPL
jgi:hypothetical protein